MQYSVCLDAVYAKGDFFEGMREVSELGIKAIELWKGELNYPYLFERI